LSDAQMLPMRIVHDERYRLVPKDDDRRELGPWRAEDLRVLVAPHARAVERSAIGGLRRIEHRPRFSAQPRDPAQVPGFVHLPMAGLRLLTRESDGQRRQETGRS